MFLILVIHILLHQSISQTCYTVVNKDDLDDVHVMVNDTNIDNQIFKLSPGSSTDFDSAMSLTNNSDTCPQDCTFDIVNFKTVQDDDINASILSSLDFHRSLVPSSTFEYINDDVTIKCARQIDFCGATVPIYRYYRLSNNGIFHAYSFSADTVIEGYTREFYPMCYVWPSSVIGSGPRTSRSNSPTCPFDGQLQASNFLPLTVFDNGQQGALHDHYTTTITPDNTTETDYTETMILGKVLKEPSSSCGCLTKLVQLIDDQDGVFKRLDHKIVPEGGETDRPYEQYRTTGEVVYCVKSISCGATLPLWKHFHFFDVDSVYSTTNEHQAYSYLYPPVPLCYIWASDYDPSASPPADTVNSNNIIVPPVTDINTLVTTVNPVVDLLSGSTTVTPVLDGSTVAPLLVETASTIDGVTIVPTIDGASIIPTIEVSTIVPTIDGVTIVPTVEVSTIVPTIDGVTIVPTIDGSTIAPTIEGSDIVPTVGVSTIDPLLVSTDASAIDPLITTTIPSFLGPLLTTTISSVDPLLTTLPNSIMIGPDVFVTTIPPMVSDISTTPSVMDMTSTAVPPLNLFTTQHSIDISTTFYPSGGFSSQSFYTTSTSNPFDVTTIFDSSTNGLSVDVTTVGTPMDNLLMTTSGLPLLFNNPTSTPLTFSTELPPSAVPITELPSTSFPLDSFSTLPSTLSSIMEFSSGVPSTVDQNMLLSTSQPPLEASTVTSLVMEPSTNLPIGESATPMVAFSDVSTQGPVDTSTIGIDTSTLMGSTNYNPDYTTIINRYPRSTEWTDGPVSSTTTSSNILMESTPFYDIASTSVYDITSTSTYPYFSTNYQQETTSSAGYSSTGTTSFETTRQWTGSGTSTSMTTSSVIDISVYPFDDSSTPLRNTSTFWTGSMDMSTTMSPITSTNPTSTVTSTMTSTNPTTSTNQMTSTSSITSTNPTSTMTSPDFDVTTGINNLSSSKAPLLIDPPQEIPKLSSLDVPNITVPPWIQSQTTTLSFLDVLLGVANRTPNVNTGNTTLT